MSGNLPTTHRRWRQRWMLGVWVLACAAGLGFLWAYGGTPGDPGRDPAHWPTETSLSLAREQPTLVMFLHPKCPCSRTSLDELASIVTNNPNAFSLNLVFFQPSGEDDTWTKTDLWKKAKAIPNAKVTIDQNAHESALFGAATSGDAYIFDPSGKLQFHGGVTAGRGVVGPSTGQEAVLSLARNQSLPQDRFAVFGCPIVQRTP